ncbi:MAG: Hsp70 family protein [Eubacterium sp.]|jgi:molecular chaperone DnaK|nr:Hsp70 family protein [Eubacterium sp.]
MENKAFGIDLGTTYSCISYVDDISGEPVVVDNSEGTNVTPSIVCFEDEDTIVVGNVAKETAVVSPEATCEFVKRRMGVDKVAITYNGTDYSPEQISSLILKKLVKDAEEALDTKIKDVVITCPAYFGIAEKTATENAGKMAGLNVLEIINEPTAAALCYGSLRDVEDKTILVYDLGGGTFDVTIIRVTPEEIVAIATDGDHQLGGKDWDTAVMNCVEEVFRDQKSFDDEFDLEAQQDLRLRAEKAKQQLTGRPKTKVIVQASGAKANIEFTRDEFDEITSALLSQTLDKTKAAIEAAEKKGVTKIDEIILVGGSCKMPQVRAAVEGAYPDIPVKMFEPNTAVAKGAALHAEALSKGHVELQKWRDELKEAVENLNKDRAQEDKIDIDTLTEDTISKEDMEAIKKEVEKNGGDAQKVKFAIGGKAREGGKQGPVLRNITSKSFGVQIVRDEMVDGKMEMVYKIANLIQKQDAVPVTVTQEFGTAYANMENAEIVVFETEVTEEVYDVGSNRVLGAAVLNLPPNLPEGAPIQITFSLSTDGLLSMKGVDMTSNQEVKTILKTDSILTEEDVAAQTQALKGIRLN